MLAIWQTFGCFFRYFLGGLNFTRNFSAILGLSSRYFENIHLVTQCLVHFFRVLAHEQADFLGFPEGDRQVLLRRNSRLFVQYFLGRFFFAGSGVKQHQWLLLCQVK